MNNLMEWRKLGCVYRPDGSLWWARQAAMIPTPLVLNDDIVRVFVTCCDEKGIGRPGYVDLDAREPMRVVAVGREPVLDIGRDGAFDENGVLACSIVPLDDGGLFMYYAGFELGTKIRYRLLTGLAVSRDAGGQTFQRVQQTPVLERSEKELFFRGGPFVIRENGRFRIWYVAGSDWERVGKAVKPVYEIRTLESDDGIHWPNQGEPCIRIEGNNEHGFGRPYVVCDDGLYRMFYSVRRRDLESYRLGYAESVDGRTWTRCDHRINLDVTPDGWDSTMICYSAVICLHGTWYMLYNGNDFGRTGFGLAQLVSW